MARIRQEIGVFAKWKEPPPPPPIEPPRPLITVVRNRNNRANNFSQLDGTSHHGVDHDDNGENTNRPPKPPYPEETDGLEETDNQEPEETNETDASVGESYDAMWKRATEMCNGPILEMWGCVVCPDGPKIDKGEEESAICNLCKNNMELPPLPMQCECCICSAINLYTDFAVQSQEFRGKR